MPLTDTAVRNAKPKERQYKLYNQEGLYLIVTPAGGKWWRFDYSIEGKRNTISLGVYPGISLREDHQRKEEIRTLTKQSIHPSSSKAKKEEDFKTLALEWFERKRNSWVERHAVTVINRINNYIIPALGDKDPSEITPQEIYRTLHIIEDLGKVETAYRVKQILSMIFRYGIIKGVVQRDPTIDLGRGVLISIKSNHYPTILDPDKIGALLRAIDGYEHFIVRHAIKLLVLTFVRPGDSVILSGVK